MAVPACGRLARKGPGEGSADRASSPAKWTCRPSFGRCSLVLAGVKRLSLAQQFVTVEAFCQALQVAFRYPDGFKMRAPGVDYPDDLDDLCGGLGRLKPKRIALGHRVGQRGLLSVRPADELLIALAGVGGEYVICRRQPALTVHAVESPNGHGVRRHQVNDLGLSDGDPGLSC